MEYVKAFVFGGLLCVIGQILIDRTTLTPPVGSGPYAVTDVRPGERALDRRQERFRCRHDLQRLGHAPLARFPAFGHLAPVRADEMKAVPL